MVLELPVAHATTKDPNGPICPHATRPTAGGSTSSSHDDFDVVPSPSSHFIADKLRVLDQIGLTHLAAQLAPLPDLVSVPIAVTAEQEAPVPMGSALG